MKKFCVFCGKYPVSKNKEHVISQWLIKETEDPNRKAQLGIDWKAKKTRKFSWDQLVFPACSKCNNIFSKVEKEAQSVIYDVLSERPLTAKSLNIMLTWFDKIRTGIWLGLYYLDKNIFGIIPNFYILSRVSARDRMLLIYKTFEKQKGLQLMKIDTPFFGHMPSCFGLIINQFYFINLSSDFLFSRRLGLPYPKIKKVTSELKTHFKIVEGLERILMPLVRISYDSSCTEIYQPIIPREILNWQSLAFYKTSYVKKFFKSSRIGDVLIKKSEKEIIKYPKGKSSIWIPNKTHSSLELIYIVEKTVIKLQNYLLSDLSSLEDLDEENKIRHKNAYKQVKIFNNYLLREIEKEWKLLQKSQM